MINDDDGCPPGNFRVIGIDTFSSEDWIVGDYDTLEKAQKVATDRGGEMCVMRIYDDSGQCVGSAGSL